MRIEGLGPFLLINCGLAFMVLFAWLADRRSVHRRRRLPFIVAVLPAVLIGELLAVSTLQLG